MNVDTLNTTFGAAFIGLVISAMWVKNYAFRRLLQADAI